MNLVKYLHKVYVSKYVLQFFYTIICFKFIACHWHFLISVRHLARQNGTTANHTVFDVRQFSV